MLTKLGQDNNHIVSKGFTLIEILVVIAIISVLMGMILSGGNQAKKRARIYKTKAMITSLETALALYHTDFGAYPAAGNQNLVNDLADTDGNASNNDWHGPYMSFKAADLNGSIPAATVLDAWGKDYKYNNPYPLGDVPPYEIKSLGPDGKDGTDDISNL